ncbi:hypothetical protein [Neobacillus sp. LXY-4]|uniref:hypothetical protein n=1 Tax=Neobacillus sp. LXY-4 TaxID=3379826 RepID=UPI003EDFDFEA
MKGYLSLLFGSMIVVLMLVLPGNAAQAAEPVAETGDSTDHCGCDVSYIVGAEKNKLVSNLLKSDEFKVVKAQQKNNGYEWNGIDGTEVIQNHTKGGIILIGVPFINDGVKEMAAFLLMNDLFIYLGNSPA